MKLIKYSAFESLNDVENKEVYDNFFKNEPHFQEWKYKEELYRNYENEYNRDKAKNDKFSQDDYRGNKHSNFERRTRDSFEEQEKYKDFDSIFRSEKKKTNTKGDDILVRSPLYFRLKYRSL